jgi:hypothetical protein
MNAATMTRIKISEPPDILCPGTLALPFAPTRVFPLITGLPCPVASNIVPQRPTALIALDSPPAPPSPVQQQDD